MIRLRKTRGQSAAEYAILIGVVIAAAVAMQTFMQRAFQAKTLDAWNYSKTVGEDAGVEELFVTDQYEPYYLGSDMQTVQDTKSGELQHKGGALERQVYNEFVYRTGTQTIGNYAEWTP